MRTALTNQLPEPTKPYIVGEQLRAWRQEAGMSIDQLAEALRYRAPELRRSSREYVRRYEKGDIDGARLDVVFLVLVADILGHDARDLGPDIAALINLLSATIQPPKARSRATKTGSRCNPPQDCNSLPHAA